MGFVMTNPNPANNFTGDCVIRAISIAENKEWDDVFVDLMLKSFEMKDIPSANNVWSSHLHDLGYSRFIIPDTCPDCYVVEDFTDDHPTGTYILATGTHVIAVKNGDYYDTWNSGGEVPIYYFKKGEIKNA